MNTKNFNYCMFWSGFFFATQKQDHKEIAQQIQAKYLNYY